MVDSHPYLRKILPRSLHLFGLKLFLPHVGVSTLCTGKGLCKVERLTTCTSEWNVGWFPSISEINSIPELGFNQGKIISAKKQCI